MIGFFGNKLEKDSFLMSFFIVNVLMLNKFIIIHCKRVDNKL